MPGLVVRVLVVPGQAIDAGTITLVLEAMKMENELRAAGPSGCSTPGSGRLRVQSSVFWL